MRTELAKAALLTPRAFPVALVSAPAPPSSTPQEEGARPKPTCSHCGKQGHTYQHCYRRKKNAAREARDMGSAAEAPQGRSLQPLSHASRQIPPFRQTPPSPASRHHRYTGTPASPWCSIHGRCGDSSDNCVVAKQMRQTYKGRQPACSAAANAPKSLVECMCASIHHPG